MTDCFVDLIVTEPLGFGIVDLTKADGLTDESLLFGDDILLSEVSFVDEDFTPVFVVIALVFLRGFKPLLAAAEESLSEAILSLLLLVNDFVVAIIALLT